jgi:hypothetical protein
LESSNPPPRTKATAGLPEQKKAAHVRRDRGVAGGRTGIGNSGLRLACDGQLRLCLQLETGLFVTGASPRGCRRRLVVKSPAIKPSRQHGIREGSSGFDCWKTPAAVAAMLLRKPAGGRRKARGFTVQRQHSVALPLASNSGHGRQHIRASCRIQRNQPFRIA